ncbi:MAG: HAMP domain-containing protein [Candidatus Omnitrophica bacterium]|nr:HAMP domain-containing protein [Candidatus Omnitrophota bacterium]
MRLGLRGKLLALTLGLLVILTAGALVTVRHFFGQQLHHQAERSLKAGSHVFTSILERSGNQLLDRGKLLAELPSLRTALTKDRGQLEPLLSEVKAIRAANLLWATDPSGKVLASTGEYPALGSDLSGEPLIHAALEGQQTLGFDLFGGEWWLLLTLPVKEEKSGLNLGSVTLCLLIGESYLERLSQLMECQIAFVWGENQLWAQGWPEAIRKEAAAKAPRAPTLTPFSIWAPPMGRFLWLARPVTGGVPPIASGPIAILGTRLDESVIRRSTTAIVGIAGLTMVLGALLLSLGIRSVTKPLKVLVADSKRIGAGDLSHRSRVLGEDEVAELAGSFNEMVERLQGSYRELTELNQTLEERVQERTRELEQAQAQLLQAEKLASIGELAAGVAHELNNPLMVIMGNAQLGLRMLKKPDQPLEGIRGELQDLLASLDQESHRSKMIVSNLSDFARVRPPSRVAVDLHTLLDESIRLVAHQASLQSVEVVKKYGSGLPPVEADSGQIKQVFVNIILNAVQAMPEGGTLTLETKVSEGHLVTVIRDTGVGIPPEAIPKVFDPFFTTKEVGKGTGLGMSVSYGIIQRHQGEISLASEVGKGTAVTLKLPLKGSS